MLEQLSVEFTVAELCSAIRKDDVTIMKLFHLAGVDLESNCRPGGEATLFYVAVDWGAYNTYRYLLDQNVDINANTSSGSTALIRSISHKQYDMTYELLRLGALAHRRGDTSALEYALLDCDPNLVAALLENGASVEERYEFANRTPLGEAAGDGCTASVRLLLAVGAEVNAATDYGNTALFDAVSSGSSDSVKLLIDAGATIDHRSQFGGTPLLFAISRGYSLVVTQLLKAGADPNQVYRMTPSETPFAVPENQELRDAITVGPTPLMIAAALGDSEITDALLKNGADATVTATGQSGTHTASTIAESAGFHELSNHLRSM